MTVVKVPSAGATAADASMSGDALKLFISYSRTDVAAAEALVVALESEGFEVKIDRRDLPYGEEWQAELGDFIRNSDTVVWLVSPSSIDSRWCNWELGEVGRLSKRLVPVVIRTVTPQELPEALGKIQLLPAEGVYEPARHLSSLVKALETDHKWVKEATRLADRAREWVTHDRSSSLLLRGAGLKDAEEWSSHQPKAAPPPASEVLELILASRRGAVRRHRWAVASALGIAVVGFALAGLAWWQRDVAIQQRDNALTTQSRFVANRSGQLSDEHDAGSAALLALEGMADSALGLARPHVPETEEALFKSLRDLREVAVLAEHKDQVSSAVFSRDGRRLLTASRDHTARIWDVETRRVVAVFGELENDFIWNANFSSDGRRIVTAGHRNGATIWDSETGKLIRRGQEGRTWDAAFSPDGKRVVATRDNTAQIWDAETGVELVVLSGHAGAVFGVDFSPDGQHVVTAARDGTARIWDGRTGNEIRTLKGNGSVFSAKFSPDGRQIVTASRVVQVWDSETGEEIEQYTSHSDRVFSASFSADGHRIVTASMDRTSRVLDLTSGREIVLGGHFGTVWSASLSPDGRYAATASEDGTVRIWNCEPSAVFEAPDKNVSSVVFSSDSRRVLTGMRDGTAKVWDVLSGKIVKDLSGHTGPVLAVAFSADNQQILTASSDSTVRLWNAETGSAESTNKIEGRAVSASFSANAPRLLTQMRDTVQVWDAKGNVIATIADPEPDPNAGVAYDAALSRDGRRLVTSRVATYGDPIRVWDVASGKETFKFQRHRGPASRVALSPDGRTVASLGFEDRTARIWDSETGTVVATLTLPGRGEAVSFSPDGKRVAIASAELQVWDIKSAKTVAAFDVLETGDVRLAVFSPDQRRLATVSDDNGLRIWRIFPDADDLVAATKRAVPRCLTRSQRHDAFLDRDPPTWCATMAKWVGQDRTVLMSTWKFNP